jgi:hypothetical protein
MGKKWKIFNFSESDHPHALNGSQLVKVTTSESGLWAILKKEESIFASGSYNISWSILYAVQFLFMLLLLF